MTTSAAPAPAPSPRAAAGGEASPEHVDVLIVGAGLSGIGAAAHLQRERPGTSYVVLEARGSLGGTWDLFRYPGIRSDSDMFTLGYSFKPWTAAKSIADGADILDYVTETAHEHGVDRNIRYHQRVVGADWSSDTARWTVRTEHAETGAAGTFTCRFLVNCSGYYRYDEGYTPDFEGVDDFTGPVIHPQHWPEDLDVAGKHVVVIGSGATAVTLVPALARTAGHVTMLQRSPSYVMTLPGHDAIADFLRAHLPARIAYPLVRWKNVLMTTALYQLARRRPGAVKSLVRKAQEKVLPEGFDIDTHFTPRYDPWDQRLCLVPDGDLFKALADGSASMVTDHIDRFTRRGVRLQSGEELAADVIVTATGLNLLPLGGLELTVDGREVEVSERVAYKGMMLADVPNFAFVLGYTNASWTLKADLVSGYVCRLLARLDAEGLDVAMPRPPADGAPTEPFIDLAAGYIQRSIDELPRQGSRAPWRLHQNYLKDIGMFRRGEIGGEGLELGRRGELRPGQPGTQSTAAAA